MTIPHRSLVLGLDTTLPTFSCSMCRGIRGMFSALLVHIKSHIMANSASRIRPPLLPVSRTCIWKVVGQTEIRLDIYLPSSNNGSSHPILLFIHGGGWIASNRTDYSRPMFHQFLSLGFVIVSMDYRLLPETKFNGQLEDVRDIEAWLKNRLPSELEESNFAVNTDKIVVAGGSAGAHLALLTPKLWSTPPIAILSMYGPTDMNRVPYLQRGRLSKYDAPKCTPEVLAEATNFPRPPSDTGCFPKSSGFSTPRSQISFAMFRGGTTAEFLLKGLVRGEDGTLRMPEKGCVSREEINAISPLHLSKTVKYPPTYQIMGTADDIFDTYHVLDFHAALQSQNIKCERVLIPRKGHAFDIYESIGGELHTKYLTPAVEWVAGFAMEGGIRGQGRLRVGRESSLESLPRRPIFRCCC